MLRVQMAQGGALAGAALAQYEGGDAHFGSPVGVVAAEPACNTSAGRT